MSGRVLRWPTWRTLGTGIMGALVVSAVFFPVYIGGAALAESRAVRWQLYASWELAIPFWPAMIVPYLSMFVLFVIPPLWLDASELIRLTKQLVVATLIGALVFILLPADLGYPDHADAGIWQPLFDLIYAIDNRHNTVPSLHVVYTSMILLAFIDVAKPAFARLCAVWLVGVCASTVLTHRHHLADVACGLAIVLAVRGRIFQRLPLRLPFSPMPIRRRP